MPRRCTIALTDQAFSTVGLVLAVLPLVISAIEHYNEGLKPLKDFVRWKITIRNLIVGLRTQKALFRNTLEQLLGGLVTDQTELSVLLDDPAGSGWKSPKLETDLKQRLRHSFDVYIENVVAMDSHVCALEEHIGLDVYGKVCQSCDNKLRKMLIKSLVQPRWNDARSHKKAWKKFIVCLSQRHQEHLLSRMAQTNFNLKNLTKDSIDLEPTRLARRRGTEPFRKVRDCARDLHVIFRERWCCTCNYTHGANLQLETRNTECTPSFRVLFPSVASSQTQSLNTIWKETVIRPVDEGVRCVTDERLAYKDVQLSGRLASLAVTSTNCQVAMVSSTTRVNIFEGPDTCQDHQPSALTTFLRKGKVKRVAWAKEVDNEQETKSSYNFYQQAVSNPKVQKTSLTTDTTHIRISSLCHALKDANCKGKVEECLGHLTDQDRQLGVWIVGQHSLSAGPETMTLREILSRGMSPYPGDGPRAPLSTLKSRLELAATLSSTALQLQNTPWLDSDWNSEDVLFHTGIAAHPYITKLFDTDAGQREGLEKIGEPTPVRNKTIFNLGVLLLEIFFRRPLDHFKTAADSPIFTEFSIAKRLVESLAEEASARYADAVTACIYGDFGRGVKDHNFDNDAFRQAVYDHVITPLEEDWRHFNGIR